MSVKERYDALVAEQKDIEEAERQRIQAEKEFEQLRRSEAQRIWLDKRESEMPGILNNLELMAVRLRKMGILSMIEEFTNRNIYNLYISDPEIQIKLTPKQITQRMERAARHLGNSLRYTNSEGWEVRPLIPELNSETLIWENTDKVALDIRKEHRNMRNREPFRVLKTEHVHLLYDCSLLAIAGEHEEFFGRIPLRKNQRVDILESAFARAFFKPRIEVPKIPQRYFRESDYNTPIGLVYRPFS